jgi:uncharacterized protein YkwD
MRKPICVLVMAVFVWLAVGVAAAGPAVAFDRRASESTLLRLINHARTRRGLASLHLSTALDRAALSHSREMLSHNRLSHSSIGGGSYSGRLLRAGYSRKGCTSWAVSEAIGWGAGARGRPQAIFRAWMRSSCHRSLLLGKRWRDVGIGAASGAFRGLSGAVLVTVDLGRRAK